MGGLYRQLVANIGCTVTETRLTEAGKSDIRLDEGGVVITECDASLLTALVTAVQPTCIAEVGSGAGRSLAALLLGAGASDRLTGRVTELWSCDTSAPAIVECRKKFAGLLATLVEGGVDAMLDQMPVRPDFAFIDGDHSMKGVTRDFQAVNEAMRSGGLIVLHDSTSAPAVAEFCTEIGALLLPTCKGMALWRKP